VFFLPVLFAFSRLVLTSVFFGTLLERFLFFVLLRSYAEVLHVHVGRLVPKVRPGVLPLLFRFALFYVVVYDVERPDGSVHRNGYAPGSPFQWSSVCHVNLSFALWFCWRAPPRSICQVAPWSPDRVSLSISLVLPRIRSRLLRSLR